MNHNNIDKNFSAITVHIRHNWQWTVDGELVRNLVSKKTWLRLSMMFWKLYFFFSLVDVQQVLPVLNGGEFSVDIFL